MGLKSGEQYYGISVSNGLIGAVSSQQSLRLSSTVLAGTYDKMGRGKVDNLLQTFSAFNIRLSFNGNDINAYNHVQSLNMKDGSMTSSFSSSTCDVVCRYYALKSLPHVFYVEMEINPHQDGQLVVSNVHEAPDYLNNVVKNY